MCRFNFFLFIKIDLVYCYSFKTPTLHVTHIENLFLVKVIDDVCAMLLNNNF